MNLDIRLEDPKDHRAVEELTREAFWNVHVPGCCEHYILHQLRKSADFIPGLDFVAVSDGHLVGNVVHTTSHIIDQSGEKHQVITFGPLSVLPSMQKQGVGSALVRHSIGAATRKGCTAICIYGNPRYYSRFGFQAAEKYHFKTSAGKYAAALLALELTDGALQGIGGRFIESAVFEADPEAVEAFDKSFPAKEKLVTPSQERFKLLSNLVH